MRALLCIGSGCHSAGQTAGEVDGMQANVNLNPSWRLQMMQDDADGNVACHGTDASWEAVDHDSNII
jgi:hypothetical protein